MFTGLIEEIGTVERLVKQGSGSVLTVAAREVTMDIKKGDSVSINGACQTVTEFTPSIFSVFVSPITSSITTLGTMNRGTRVNLERAMTGLDRFGGHIVQGHVDGMGAVKSVSRDSDGMRIEISIDAGLSKYIVGKGSIAVDGVSLTVVDAGSDTFSVYCIPETMARTILGDLKRGDRVNIEVDILAKYVEKMLSPIRESAVENKDRDLKRKLMDEGYGV